MKILLAVDPEGLAESLVPIAAALARESGGHVVAVAVCAADDPPEHSEAGRRRLSRVTEELGVAGVSVEPVVRRAAARASVADEIVASVHEKAADLVALGTHGRRDATVLVRGSVAQEVAARVDVPVVLVHAGGPDARLTLPASLRRIMVPVDYGEAASHAVRLACDLALPERAQVLVVHVRETVPWGDPPYIESEEEAERLVQDLARGLRQEGCDAGGRVTRPELSVAHTLATEAERWNADLIVLSSRRRTALGGLLLGSTAHGVVRRTSRPVLLIGHPTTRRPRRTPGHVSCSRSSANRRTLSPSTSTA